MPGQVASVDVVILTVTQAELTAACNVLQIGDRRHKTEDGTVYLLGGVHSELARRDYVIALACIGDAGNSGAAVAAARAIETYRPRAVLLMGVAAGLRGKVKIGDVVLSERVVAYEPVAPVRSDGGTVEATGPEVDRAPHSMRQDVVHYRGDPRRLQAAFERAGGVIPAPTADQADAFRVHVADAIAARSATIASGEQLLLDPSTLIAVRALDGKGEVGELEAIGVVEACRRAAVPWLVIRGISDLGDELKDDRFHAFAACAAAAVLHDFLTRGLDLGAAPPTERDRAPLEALLVRDRPADHRRSAEPPNRRVFLSYTRRDRERSNGVRLLLEIGGAEVFMDWRSIRPGDDWRRALATALGKADVLCVLWSRFAQTSKWVRREYRQFLESFPNRQCVPLCLDETPLPRALARRQAPPEFLALVTDVVDTTRRLTAAGMSRAQRRDALRDKLRGAGLDPEDPRVRKLILVFGGGFSLAVVLHRALETFAGKLVAATLILVSVFAIAWHSCSDPPTPKVTRPALPPDGSKRTQPALQLGGEDGGEAVDAAPAADASPRSPPDLRGFQIVSPQVEIDPGVEVTYCYYFRTPNTSDLSIKRWTSRMTAGGHDMILYLTAMDKQPPGTQSVVDCGILSGSVNSAWTYAAQTPSAQLALPQDDGAGHPVGQLIKAGQSGFLQIHYLNPTGRVLQAHVELHAEAYDDGVQVTPAGSFVALAQRLSLGPGSPAAPTQGMVAGICVVPPSGGGVAPRFFAMTTYTHRRSIHTFIKDGNTTLFNSTSWEQPGTASWHAPSFYTFASSTLKYQCDYLNPTSRTITAGDNAVTDEMCMAIGLYFPAPGGTGHICLDSTLEF